jgi:hypothetical protein
MTVYTTLFNIVQQTSLHRKSFFYLLKKLLDDNKVVFFPPEPNSKIKKYKYYSNGEYYADSGLESFQYSASPNNVLIQAP